MLWILAIGAAFAQAQVAGVDASSAAGGAGAGLVAALVAIIGQQVVAAKSSSSGSDDLRAAVDALREAQQNTALALVRIETRMERTDALSDDLRALAATSAALAQEVRALAPRGQS